MSKVWTKQEIVELLDRNDTAVGKGLVTIYSLQTDDEVSSDATKHRNGLGFSGLDAKFLSSVARSYIIYGRLTAKQLLISRKKIKKYAGQLMRVANGELVTDVKRITDQVLSYGCAK